MTAKKGYIELAPSWRIYSIFQFWLELHDRIGQNGTVAKYLPDTGIIEVTGMVPFKHWEVFLRAIDELTKFYPCCSPVTHIQGGYHVNKMSLYVDPPEYEAWAYCKAYEDRDSSIDVLRYITAALGLELVVCDDKWKPITREPEVES